MTIFFFPGTKLVLSSGSTKVNPVTVIMNDTQDFWVDPGMDPWAADGRPLNLNLDLTRDPVPQTRAFFITDSKAVGLFRFGKLNFDLVQLGAWHGNFDICRAIRLQMQLSNATHVDLPFDMRCTEHSAVPIASSVKFVLDSIAFVALAFVNFAFALFTFRFLRKPKAFPPKDHRPGAPEGPAEGTDARSDSSRAA